MQESRIACVCLALALCGCHLVDERDFNSAAERPPTPKVVSALPPPPSLVRISYTTPDPDYHDALASLVQRALARKADVLFTVVTLVPPAAGTDAQTEDAETAAASGREVAQQIVDDGASSGQVEQLVRIAPALKVKEVTVDVH